MPMQETVPNVVFKTRVRDESVEGPNPYRWQDTSSDDIFAGKKLLCSLCQVHLHLPVLQIICRDMKNCLKILELKELMKFTVFLSMTLL